MIRRPPRSTLSSSSAASDVYKRQDPAGRDEMLGLIQRISSDFAISVVVTSHLLGELERIADHIVVIEAGVLQRSTSTADATQLSGVLLVEVTDGAPELVARLRAAGAQVADDGGAHTFTVELAGEWVLDAVQDGAADLGVGLVRMQRRPAPRPAPTPRRARR